MKNLLLLLILMILFICTTAYSNELFTSNVGLIQSEKVAITILGDKISLYQVQCCPEHNDSMGYCLEWKYTYCNSDTCIEIALTKSGNEFKSSIYPSTKSGLPIIGLFINSDSVYKVASKCEDIYPYFDSYFVNGYTLSNTEEDYFHFNWFVLLLGNGDSLTKGNCNHQFSDYHQYIDPITGHCFGFANGINDKPKADKNIQEIYWDYLNDEIIINPMNNDIDRINQIEVIDMLGNCKVKLSDIDNPNMNISTKDWFSGVYYFIVKSGKNIRTGKFGVVH